MSFRHHCAAAAVALLCTAAQAQGSQPVRIGLIVDQSSVYSAVTGKGSITGAQMAIEEHGGKVLGRTIELLNFDHQSKADSAASKAGSGTTTASMPSTRQAAPPPRWPCST